jgi:tannase
MRSSVVLFAATAFCGFVGAASLADVCTTSYVQSTLPSGDIYASSVILSIDSSSVTANPVYNASSTGAVNFPDATFTYCNVTFAYTHPGRNGSVNLWYWLPAPSAFGNRYLSTGGGGYAINSGSGSLPGGIIYNAVAGATDGGFGSFSSQFDDMFPLQNGTANFEALFMFSYQAQHELSVIGKQFTKNFFGMNSTKLYSYYQGCSEGGREGFSQIQRFGEESDGAVIGAPALRFSFQQIQHSYSNLIEIEHDYYPSPCELEKILNETIAFCDPLDGKTDGVVSRSDLCKLQFNANSTVGMSYSCAASTGGGGIMRRQMGGVPTSTPAQNGTVTAKAAAIVNKIWDGIHDSAGKRVYLSYQPGAALDDAATAYDSTTSTWKLSINSMGTEFITRFIKLLNTSTLSSLDGITYDTLKEWMYEGWQMYEDTLHTTWPDLTPFQEAGGKILHYHGESDYSIPTASSVRYHDSVRSVMYSGMSYNDSISALSEWYKLYLIPGAGHCGTNSAQPNGPFPQTTLDVLIDWVENKNPPTTLNATVLQGDNKGQHQQICEWPLRPLWKDDVMDCVFDQASLDTWLYDLDAFKMPVY